MKRRHIHRRSARARVRAKGSRAFGKYRIVQRLGHGGMGTVYRAVDETLDREVAIKVLHPKLADPRTIARFRAEATTLARLNHPEIATIYELFRSEQALLIVMELVRGETLESVCIRSGALPAPSAASIVDRILSALEHAHQAGIVHCDIKPANVMVLDGGGIKIMDFGTARVCSPRALTLAPPSGGLRTPETRTREPKPARRFTMGTPAYMSPEHVLGQDVDGRADLYAAGVVLYRLLTANLPFSGDSALAVAKQHIAQEPTGLRDHRPDLPEWCDAIVRKALAKSPADRFQTAGEFREALLDATGMSAAALSQAFTISIKVPETHHPARSVAPTRIWQSKRRRRGAARTMVIDEGARTLALFRGVVKRRSRDVVPKNRKAFLVGALAATVAAGIAVLAVVGGRRPPVDAAAAPPNVEPVVFHARSCEPRAGRPRDTACRVVFSDDRISVKAAATDKPLHDVKYGEVRSVSYSHGYERPTDVPRVSLRTTSAKSELIVLRFDSDTPARQAVGEIEKRTDRHATPSRETPESVR